MEINIIKNRVIKIEEMVVYVLAVLKGIKACVAHCIFKIYSPPTKVQDDWWPIFF